MSKPISLPLLKIHQGSNSSKNISMRSELPSIIIEKELRAIKSPENRNFLIRSREKSKKGSMESYTGCIGPKAKLDFMHTYRYRSEITERNKFEKLESTPSAAYLEVIDKKRLNPVPFGIVRSKGNESEVDIHGYFMGDNYAAAFSEGLKKCKSVEKVNLKSNRLSEKGSTTILQKLDLLKIRDLCLSDNKIGINSIRKISELLIDPKTNLRHLSLESIALNDTAGNIIFEALANNSSITKINLAKNSLTETSARSLRNMLWQNTTLRRLDLHWNKFTGRGCYLIFDGLSKNQSLVEFDLSWNLMVRNLDNESLESIAKILGSQTVLRHLDLSSNYLNGDQCKILANGLLSNHVLLGIHMAGNDCIVDSRGFMIANNYISKVEQGHFMSRMLGDRKKHNHSSNNCWLCERWVEMKFIFKESVTNEPVCLHLECDDYQPDLMANNGEFYTLTRAVPPGPVNFFFSVNFTFIKSNEFSIKKLASSTKKDIVFWGDVKDSLLISSLNQTEAIGNVCNYKEPFKTQPRVPGLEYIPPAIEMEKIPWSIKISLFKDYKIDDEDILDDCFEFDWRHSRISNIVKDIKDLEQTRAYLRSNYQIIKESFKTLSAYSGSEIPCIGSNTFIELLSSCNLFDNLYGVSDFGVNWNSAIVPSIKGQVYNPANSLVRYEFLELIVRVSFDRYIRTKTLSSLSQAVKTLMQEFLLSKLTPLCSNEWRLQNYFCEIVDVTLKAHKPIFDSIFKRFSGRKSLPGQKPFMSLEEFRDLCTISGLVNETFSARNIDACYFQSMMTQTDELYKKRHMEMTYVEFLEAITRACDLAAVPTRNEERLEFQQKNLTLQNKIENAARLLISLCPQALHETFIFPTSKTYEKLMFRPKGKFLRKTTLNLLEDDLHIL